ncbi:MAG: hypothetical protein CVU71_09185 [Deltaproteobacteria bacterium HGW-Deltaproteobacteria-6]|jgi:hypothetical protein|nr:MAG: hypothetical protein CVU71_09185 [Deltaproteobacteria bacterium HGW-Deltaproteobacteria-6]
MAGMMRRSLFIKDVTTHLSEKTFFLTGPALIFVLFICSTPRINHAEASYALAQTVADNLKNENERQKLKKHVLGIPAHIQQMESGMTRKYDGACLSAGDRRIRRAVKLMWKAFRARAASSD